MPNTGLDVAYPRLSQNAIAVHSFGVSAWLQPWLAPAPPSVDEQYGLPMLRSCTFSNHQFSKLDITHLFSPDRYREYMPGFGEGGQLQMTFLYFAGLYNTLHNVYIPRLLAGSLTSPTYYHPQHNRLRLNLYDPYGSALRLRGFLQPPTIEVGEDAPLLSSLTFEVSGKPVYQGSVFSP